MIGKTMSAAVQILEPEADVRAAMRAIGAKARKAARTVANAPAGQKNRALTAAARLLRERAPDILAANARDLADGQAKGLTPAFLDRLALNEARIEAIARGLEDVAALPDPVGRTLATFARPNGLDHRAGRDPARRRGRHLREPPERHRRRRRALPEERQRGRAARRLGQLPFVGRDPRLPRRRPSRGRAAGSRDLAGAVRLARRGRRDAGRPRRNARRHRAARRQEPRRAGAARGARAGLRPSRGHRARLRRPGGRTSTRR